jgi:putative protease
VTVNIFAHEQSLKELPEFLKKLKACRPDAVILSDAGVLMLVKKYLPQTPVHLSTQMNTLNSEAVKFWQKNGVTRIILGREASLEDIKKIHQAVPKMELEVFVHGAMCMSYSGRCYLSAWLNNRSANEGSCTQPCRWQYQVHLEEPLRPGAMMPMEEDDKGSYILNSKDLCLIDYLTDLIKAGVISFKLEGRTKSVYYVSAVTKIYRMALDNLADKKIIKQAKAELQKIDNRGYTTGFLTGKETGLSRQELKTSKAQSDWQFVGQVVSSNVIPAKAGIQINKAGSRVKPGMTKMTVISDRKDLIAFKPHNVLKMGETLELLTPDNCYIIKVKEFFDDQGKKLAEVHGGTDRIYYFAAPAKVKSAWGLLRKKI